MTHSNWIKGWMKGTRGEQGSALVEFAFVVVLLLTFVFGAIDFSRFLYTDHFVGEASREGTRYASVRGASFTTACTTTGPTFYSCNATANSVQTYVQNLTPPGITSSSLTVTTTWPGNNAAGTTDGCGSVTNSPGCQVQVLVSYPFKFIFPFLPSRAAAWTVASTSVMTIAQ